MVGICGCNNRCICNYTANGKFPGDKSSDCKPGEKFENGVEQRSQKLKSELFQNLIYVQKLFCHCSPQLLAA